MKRSLLVLFIVTACRDEQAGPKPRGAPPAQQPQQPTFRVQVDYVEVDVVVTDRQGNLVRDLKKEDFQVFEDGKAQTINTFTHVDIPIERADTTLVDPRPLEPDVRTNERPFDGRVYVMVIDDLHTRFGRTQRVAIADPARQHDRPGEERPHRADESEWIEPAGLTARAGGQQHQPVGARFHRALGVANAGDIGEYQRAHIVQRRRYLCR